jgi:hypothetical protein
LKSPRHALILDMANASKLRDLYVNIPLELQSYSNLRSLSCNHCDNTQAVILEKCSLSHLNALHLDVCLKQGAQLGDLPSLNHFSQLKTLELRRMSKIDEKKITGLRTLESLSITHCGTFESRALKTLSNLTSFHWSRFYLDQDFAPDDFLSMAHLTTLKDLSLNGVVLFDSFRFMLPVLRNLVRCSIGFGESTLPRNYVPADELLNLLHALSPQNLAHLALHQIHLNNTHFEELSRFSEINSLSFTVGGDSIPNDLWFSCVANLTKLESMTLIRIGIHNYGFGGTVENILRPSSTVGGVSAAVKKLPQLNYFYISGFLEPPSEDEGALLKSMIASSKLFVYVPSDSTEYYEK